MSVLSVTRLHLRSLVHVPAFAYLAFRSARQIESADGFVAGAVLSEKGLAFWTVTVWTGAPKLRAFRNSGAHLVALRKISDLCDEASYGQFDHDSDAVPDAAEAYRRMREGGKVTKLKRPSERHALGRVCSDRVPVERQTLRPRPH